MRLNGFPSPFARVEKYGLPKLTSCETLSLAELGGPKNAH
jgi:hypothetical protein